MVVRLRTCLPARCFISCLREYDFSVHATSSGDTGGAGRPVYIPVGTYTLARLASFAANIHKCCAHSTRWRCYGRGFNAQYEMSSEYHLLDAYEHKEILSNATAKRMNRKEKEDSTATAALFIVDFLLHMRKEIVTTYRSFRAENLRGSSKIRE